MATFTKVTYASVTERIVFAYAQKVEHWADLVSRIERAAKECGPWDKETLHATFYSLRRAVGEVENFPSECATFQQRYADQMLRPISWVASDNSPNEVYSRVMHQIPKLLARLIAKVKTFTYDRVRPAWGKAQDRLELRCTQEGVLVSYWGAFLFHLPVDMGGIWPRVNTVLDAYEQKHHPPPSPTEHWLNQLPCPTDKTPPTLEEETTALGAVLTRLEQLLRTPIEPTASKET